MIRLFFIISKERRQILKVNIADFLQSSIFGVLVFAASSYKSIWILVGATIFLYVLLVIVESQPFSNVIALSSICLRTFLAFSAVIVMINLGFMVTTDMKRSYSKSMIGEKYAEMFAAIKKENSFSSQKKMPKSKRNELEYVREQISIATDKTQTYVLDAFAEPISEITNIN